MAKNINDTSDAFFWDAVSTMTPKESEESIKDLFSSAFRFAEPYISELFWVDQNFMYLNLVCGTPQHKIAEMFGVSQIGVSKRVRSSIKKIKWIILKPEKNIEIVSDYLSLFLSNESLEVAILYYQYGTYSVVSKLSLARDFNIRNSISRTINIMNSIAKSISPNDVIELIKKNSTSNLDFHKKLAGFNDIGYDYYKVKIDQYLKYFKNVQKHVKYSSYSWKKYDGTRS